MGLVSSLFCWAMGILIYLIVFVPVIFFSYVIISIVALSIIKLFNKIVGVKNG